MTIYPLVVITTERLLLTKTEKNTPPSHYNIAKVNGACEMCKEKNRRNCQKTTQQNGTRNTSLKLEFDQTKIFRPNSKGHCNRPLTMKNIKQTRAIQCFAWMLSL